MPELSIRPDGMRAVMRVMTTFVPSSFGDLITAVDLAISLVRVLSDSCGASTEYQDVILQLLDLSDTLKLALESLQSHTRARPQLVQAVRAEVARTTSTMEKFLERVRAYQDSLKKGGSGKMWKDSWRKIGWGLFKKEELIEAKRSIEAHKSSLHLRIQVLQLESSYVQRRVVFSESLIPLSQISLNSGYCRRNTAVTSPGERSTHCNLGGPGLLPPRAQALRIFMGSRRSQAIQDYRRAQSGIAATSGTVSLTKGEKLPTANHNLKRHRTCSML